jgi:hypothetical protein
MAAELSDREDIRLVRRLREVADSHVFDHALAKGARRSSRGSCHERGGYDGRRRDSTNAIESQATGKWGALHPRRGSDHFERMRVCT